MTTPQYKRLWRTTRRLERDLLSNDEVNNEHQVLQESYTVGPQQDIECSYSNKSGDDTEGLVSSEGFDEEAFKEDSCDQYSSSEDLSDNYDLDNCSNLATELRSWACRNKCTRI